MGDIVIDGDLTIGPESSLVIYSPSRVLLEGDRLGAGVDPSRCEINVEGRFEVHSGVIKRWNGFEESTDFEQSKPVVFESLPGQTWTGILPSEAAELRLDEADLRNSDYGLVEPGTKLAALGVHVATVILEEDAPPAAADTFALLTSYPNPFESETTLRYVLAEDISADDRAVERRIEMVTQISDLLRRVIGQNENSQGPVAQTVYFELGVWIQSLRAAAVAARECETSLAEVVEVADYGDTGRQFADYLRYVGAGDAIVVSIDRLANALEKQPVDDGGIGALLVQLDTIGRSVNEGAGDREQR